MAAVNSSNRITILLLLLLFYITVQTFRIKMSLRRCRFDERRKRRETSRTGARTNKNVFDDRSDVDKPRYKVLAATRLAFWFM